MLFLLKYFLIYYLPQKNFYCRTKVRVYGFHSWLKLQPYFLIGRVHWIRKRGNFFTAKKKEGLERHAPLCLKCLNVDLFYNIFFTPVVYSVQCRFQILFYFQNLFETVGFDTVTFQDILDYSQETEIILKIDVEGKKIE